MRKSQHDLILTLSAVNAALLSVGLLVCSPALADTQAAAVATADASVDSVIDHTVNTAGFDNAKSISQNDGITILQKDTAAPGAIAVTQKATPKKPTEVVTAKQPSEATLEAMLK